MLDITCFELQHVMDYVLFIYFLFFLWRHIFMFLSQIFCPIKDLVPDWML